ncbi:MAG TPA: 3-isopropylmalate dehydrogenase [Alphaproteobacteria bacterium]|nr:3-isopropylmalate dehydrogenase [Alphaproteobacteria bacterium]HNS43882.1 3-isopropylmalate dehydrogenase [Alphaproteobacteria bacterium]
MTTTRHVLITPGDGIGPEVMAEVKKIIAWINDENLSHLQVTECPIGGASIDAHGVPVTDETIELGKKADCVLLGAVGGPKWNDVDYAIRPEAGLLKIRKELGLFANLRPAIVFDALIAASTLKPEIVRGLDIMIVRELTGGVYFGEPRGIFNMPNGERQGVNTQTYTTSEIHRVARVAFDLARKRNNKVCSCEKANVMESGKLWREEVTKLHVDYADVELTHMYADNCAMQLLRNPHQFDVIVTDNLFGDILSDEASMLTGSLGMLPSASLGERDKSGHQNALYEPVHGSAPDIAGQNKANPLAAILSFAMALRFSLDLPALADHIDAAARNVLDKGLRTADIMAEGCTLLSTSEMGDAIINELKTQVKKAA